MQTQNGNGRGQQGRPTIQAPSKKTGEDRVQEILEDRQSDIEALFANDHDPKASFKRAVSLSKNAYRRMMQDAAERAASQNKPAPHIDEHSTVAAALWAMQRKLDPGSDVYFVPYGGKVQPQLGPQGVVKLVLRSGFVLSVDARAVFKGDPFDYELGSERFVKHKKGNKRPADPKAAWNALEYAYATVEMKGGGKMMVEVLDKSDIEYYRSLSPTGTYSTSLWGKFPGEAARKTVAKQVCKFVPMESEISEILTADESERGIEIPKEFWDAVGARMPEGFPKEERPSDRGAGAPGGPATNGHPSTAGAPHREGTPPAAGNLDPFAGDAKALFMPGKKGEAPKIADAENADLIKWEDRLCRALDGGDCDAPDKVKYKDSNVKQLATIRKEMRARRLEVQPHEWLDGQPAPQRGHDPSQGELSPPQEEEIFGSAGGNGNGFAAD